MMISNVKTPFMKAESRVVAQFAAEVEALEKARLRDSRNCGGYVADDE